MREGIYGSIACYAISTLHIYWRDNVNVGGS